MKRTSTLGGCLAVTMALGAHGAANDFVRIAGAECWTPPFLHCPDADCPTDRVINQGPVVEMETRRTYFLDYPCDLRPDEDVTLVLSLHGGGSYGNWQRHYFPLLDFKDAYRLVVVTPNSPTRVWSEADDRYLQNIVTFLVGQLGADRIRAFWLVGHSQGGMTSNRLLRTDFFRDRVDGWLSLSGGRLGGNPGLAPDFGPPRPPGSPPPDPAAQAEMQARFAAFRALLAELPEAPFSFVFTTGIHELDASGLPVTSSWAEKLGCGASRPLDDVVDTKGGYVYDTARQGSAAWGMKPAGGSANVYRYPDCRDGRVVADVVRLAKGHTEGLEPNVTEALVRLMVEAPGGRIRALTR